MTFDDRFPPRGQHSWQTAMLTGDSGISAQMCEECSALVPIEGRPAHHDWHELLSHALALS